MVAAATGDLTVPLTDDLRPAWQLEIDLAQQATLPSRSTLGGDFDAPEEAGSNTFSRIRTLAEAREVIDVHRNPAVRRRKHVNPINAEPKDLPESQGDASELRG